MRCSPTGLRYRRSVRARARARKPGRRRTSASACQSSRRPSISRRPRSPRASSTRSYLTTIMEGRYRESFLAAAGVDAPKVAAEDMSAISTPVDFVGINVYGPDSYVSASDAVPGFVSVPFTAKHPTMNSSWLKIGPAALYWGPRNMAKVWNVTARRPTCRPPTASSTTPTASCSCAAI